MARRTPRPAATRHHVLPPHRERCPWGTGPLLVAYHSTRTITTPAGIWHLTVRVRDPTAWQDLRQRLEERHATRRAQRRVRKVPAADLALLEQLLLT